MEQFIASINIYDYERFRARVIEACQVTRSTWSNWRNGGPIEAKYKPIIDQVAREMFGRTIFGEGGAKWKPSSSSPAATCAIARSSATAPNLRHTNSHAWL